MSLPPLQHFNLRSADGTRLACSVQQAKASEPAPTLVWIHGAFEHRKRYFALMAEFAERGFHSAALDLRGHGESGGPPAYVRRFEDYLDDVSALLRHVAANAQGKLFLVGHSMGALVVIRFLQERADVSPVSGAALSSPFLGLRSEPPAWKRALSKSVVGLLPRLAIDNGLDPADLTHDPAIIAAHRIDPLIRRKATPGWFEETTSQQAIAMKKADKLRLPLLVMTAGDDRIADSGKTRLWLKRLDLQVSLRHEDFEGFYHEIFNETERERAVNALADWLAALR